MSPLDRGAGRLSHRVSGPRGRRGRALFRPPHSFTVSRDLGPDKPARSSHRLISSPSLGTPGRTSPSARRVGRCCHAVPGLRARRARRLIRPARSVARWRDSGGNKAARASRRLTSSPGLGALEKRSPPDRRVGSRPPGLPRLSRRMAGLRFKYRDFVLEKLARSRSPPSALRRTPRHGGGGASCTIYRRAIVRSSRPERRSPRVAPSSPTQGTSRET